MSGGLSQPSELSRISLATAALFDAIHMLRACILAWKNREIAGMTMDFFEVRKGFESDNFSVLSIMDKKLILIGKIHVYSRITI